MLREWTRRDTHSRNDGTCGIRSAISYNRITYTGHRSPGISSPAKFYGLGRGVGRGLADGPDLGVGVGRGVAVADAVAVGWPLAWLCAVLRSQLRSVAVGVGVGVPPPTAAKISTRPQPYTLFGGPAVPH